ncbi:MAG: class I SAM-dependent methyltransferase [candidate division Zixibacteria bacterium]|nr:class I SAM-dependent methyltransferase [candidate division Zixibacteria bacterium]
MKPKNVLDVGCGCGSFTIQLSPHCTEVTAIDLSSEFIERSKKENQKPNITYLCMDGRDLQYPDNIFDLVLERATLHHTQEWEKVLNEMIRVSAQHILVEEPLDDPRSEAKRNTMQAQKLFLELQNEVGYSHYPYLPLENLLGYFKKRNIPLETEIIKSDEPLGLDEYFSSFGLFAEKSKRKKYWLDRLDDFKKELNGKKLCESDTLFIATVKS